MVVLLGAGSLPQGVEKEIEESARAICIENGFSTCDEVRYVSPSLAFIDFPYYEACRDFLRVTGGMLKVRHRTYKLQHSSSAPAAPPPVSVEEPTAADGTVLDHPTDELVVRQIGDLSDNQVLKAFKQVVPTVKSVRILMDRHTRKSKGCCFVSFYCVSDAETAMARLTARGSMIEGRRVSISFAKPQTHEQMLESDMCYRHEQNEIHAQAQQALGGINADMWASYLQFFSSEKEKAAQAAADKAAALKTAQDEARAAQELASLDDTKAKDAADGPGAANGDSTKPPPVASVLATGSSAGSGGFATGGCAGAAVRGGPSPANSGPQSTGSPPAAASEAVATPKAPGVHGGGSTGMASPGNAGLGPGLGPGLPNLPGMPSLGNLPGLAGLSGMPTLPGLGLPGGGGSLNPPPGGGGPGGGGVGGLPGMPLPGLGNANIPGLAAIPGLGGPLPPGPLAFGQAKAT